MKDITGKEITEFENYVEENAIIQHRFGDGREQINIAYLDGIGYLALTRGDVHKIGGKAESEGLKTLLRADTLIMFKNKQGTKVLISELKKLLRMMR
jgi:hypothetical protein